MNSGDDANKRRRVTQACDGCNKKKIRCDGTRPSCHICIEAKTECTYSRVLKKRGPRAGYIEELEARVKELEAMLAAPEPTEPTEQDHQWVRLYFDSPLCQRLHLLDKTQILQSIETQPPFLINAICAVTCDQKMAAHKYYMRAKDLLDKSIASLSYSTITGLLLLAMYISAGGNWTESWVFFGMAIRMAHQMQIHVDSHHKKFGEEEQQLRCRLWWALYEFDRYSCIISTLPFAIQEQDATIGYPVASGPEAYSIGLIELRMRLLKILTHVVLSQRPNGTLPPGMDINKDLQTWHKSLPKTYQVMYGNLNCTPEVAFLHIQYYYTLMMLFHPALLRDPFPQQSKALHILSEACRFCSVLVKYLWATEALFSVPSFLHHCIHKLGAVTQTLKRVDGIDRDMSLCLDTLATLAHSYRQAGLELAELYQSSQ